MIAESIAVVSAMKNLRDFATSLKESAEKRKLFTEIEDMQSKFIALQAAVMESQQSLSAANERARAAEQKCMDMENWDREAERYALKELTTGFFVYSLKPEMQGGESPHSLCANCFTKRQKAIVQQTYSPIGESYDCHNCKSNTMVCE